MSFVLVYFSFLACSWCGWCLRTPGEKLTLFACERGSAWMSPGFIVRCLAVSSLFPAFDFREIYYIIFLTNMTDLDTPYMSRLLKLLLMVVHGWSTCNVENCYRLCAISGSRQMIFTENKSTCHVGKQLNILQTRSELSSMKMFDHIART